MEERYAGTERQSTGEGMANMTSHDISQRLSGEAGGTAAPLAQIRAGQAGAEPPRPAPGLARGQSGARTAPAPTRARARTQMRAVKGRSDAGPGRRMNTSRTKEPPPMSFPDPTAALSSRREAFRCLYHDKA